MKPWEGFIRALIEPAVTGPGALHSSLRCLFSHRNIPWIMLVTDMGSSLQTLPDSLFPSRALALCLPPCLASSSWLGGRHWQKQPKLRTLLWNQLQCFYCIVACLCQLCDLSASLLLCVNIVIYWACWRFFISHPQPDHIQQQR